MPRQTLISLLHLGEESRSPHPSRNHFVVRRRLPPPLCLIRFIGLLVRERVCHRSLALGTSTFFVPPWRLLIADEVIMPLRSDRCQPPKSHQLHDRQWQ